MLKAAKTYCFISMALLFCGLFYFASCKKKNTSNEYKLTKNTSIKGPVRLIVQCIHHTIPVAGLKVYYKIGATDFPGTTITSYDYTAIADNHGYVQFDSLTYGNGYLYAVGYDPSVNTTVTGNMPVTFIKNQMPADNQVEQVLYVSE